MYYLVNFHLQDEHRIIRSVWGENIRKSTWEWAESAKRIRWHGNNWRTSMIEFMKVPEVMFLLLFIRLLTVGDVG